MKSNTPHNTATAVLDSATLTLSDTVPTNLLPHDRLRKVRLAAEGLVFIRLLPPLSEREGSITFSAAATDDDELLIGGITYTFGDGTGGTVDKGLDEIDSAQNLKTAVEAEAFPGLTISGAGAVLTFSTTDVGFEIEEVVDDGAVITVVPMEYVDAANADDDLPITSKEDIILSVAPGWAISLLALVDNTFCGVSEVRASS